MAPVLDDLLNDGRLARLFSPDARDCALQLWVMQIRTGQSIENRVIYGRLLPYSHSSGCWSASDDDDFEVFDGYQAQVCRLNLYIKSSQCSALLRGLSNGRSVEEVSQDIGLTLTDQLRTRFGATTLFVRELAYRPVTYLLNRDGHEQRSLSSPHNGSGAFSASITQTDKGALFRHAQSYDAALVATVVKHLNADTGLDFGDTDSQRLGDLELLVFPSLDDLERQLLSTNWIGAPPALVVRFNPIQLPHFNGFQFCLRASNNNQIVYSTIASATRDSEGLFECRFELDEKLRAIVDSIELDIFGSYGEHSHSGILCCRWRIYYIREIYLRSNALGLGAGSVKFDWLKKSTRPAASARVKAALSLNDGSMGVTNRIGGRKDDPWVSANRNLVSLFSRLHPPQSEGRFFMRWSQGDGEGRLQFVEWFRTLLAKHQQGQIVIFDPYFEDAGLGLMLLCGATGADYIVFTSLPKPSKDGESTSNKANKPDLGWIKNLATIYRYVLNLQKYITLRIYGLIENRMHKSSVSRLNPSKESDNASTESDKPSASRINNLVASCEHNHRLLKHIKLRIYGMKEGRLHDRYILIMGPDKLPITGFNLSNSFQKAAENYPLLATPIPADVLLEVEKYKSDLVREATTAQLRADTENPAMQLLFDSTASPPIASRRYEPIRFLKMPLAGDVLSVWVGQPSLRGLTGDRLKTRMTELALLKGESLALPQIFGLHSYLNQLAGDFKNFAATWDVLGEILAHSHVGDGNFSELKSERDFLEFLAQFLKKSFNRTYDEANKEATVTDVRFFREHIEELLHSSYHPNHLFHATKYSALTWAEYFTVKFLWWYAPDALLVIAETQIVQLPTEPKSPDVVRLSLLSQIISEIALSMQFDISEVQRDHLVRSSNGLLHWMGLNAIEMQLEQPEGLATVRALMISFSPSEQVRALGWMVHRAAKDPKKTDIYAGLVDALHEALPPQISADELKSLVFSMRGHMRQLAWSEPWLFQDVVFPLLRNERANTDDACEIWIEELVNMLGPQLKSQPQLFNRAREGQMTNIAALLFANSRPERRQTSVKSLQAILKRQKRIVQQPLASTSDWNRWDGALKVSMWILAFTRWVYFHLSERDTTDRKLEDLSRDARELAMIRPMSEWQSKGDGVQRELASFLEQAEELLASRNAPKDRPQ